MNPPPVTTIDRKTHAPHTVAIFPTPRQEQDWEEYMAEAYIPNPESYGNPNRKPESGQPPCSNISTPNL